MLNLFRISKQLAIVTTLFKIADSVLHVFYEGKQVWGKPSRIIVKMAAEMVAVLPLTVRTVLYNKRGLPVVFLSCKHMDNRRKLSKTLQKISKNHMKNISSPIPSTRNPPITTTPTSPQRDISSATLLIKLPCWISGNLIW